MAQAAILVGGLGTRLGSLTASTPKPLIDVGGRPFLDYVLLHLKRHSIDRVLLLAGYKAEQIMLYAHVAGTEFEMDVSVSTEIMPAGTGGALWLAQDKLDDIFLLLNGDTYLDLDPKLLLGDLQHIPHRYAGICSVLPSSINAGMYAIRKTIFKFALFNKSLEMWMARSRAFYPYPLDNSHYFVDIGTPDELARARRDLPQKEIK